MYNYYVMSLIIFKKDELIFFTHSASGKQLEFSGPSVENPTMLIKPLFTSGTDSEPNRILVIWFIVMKRTSHNFTLTKYEEQELLKRSLTFTKQQPNIFRMGSDITRWQP